MKIPIFKPFKKKVKFFMPHFPLYTGNVKALDSSKVKFLLEKLKYPQKKLKRVNIKIINTFPVI